MTGSLLSLLLLLLFLFLVSLLSFIPRGFDSSTDIRVPLTVVLFKLPMASDAEYMLSYSTKAYSLYNTKSIIFPNRLKSAYKSSLFV